MLYALIPVLLLTLSAISLSLLLKKHFSDTLAPVLFSVILVLYGAYIANVLYLGRAITIGLMLLLCVLTAVQLVRQKINVNALKELLVSPAFSMYFLAVAVFLLFSSNKFVNLMDCLRLWGAYPKILHTTGEFQMGEDSFLFIYMQSYPPGMPLLCYFLTSFGPVFSENTLFFTYSLFGFSLLLPFIGRFRWQNKNALIATFLCVIFLPWMITSMNTDDGYYYSSLFIDIPLGICCGYFLFRAFHRTGTDLFETVCTILSCTCLSLLKDSGAFLALCGVLGAFVCGYLRRKEIPFFRTILSCGSMLLLLGAVYGIWQYLMAQNGVVNGDAQVNLSGVSVVALARFAIYFFRTPITGFYSVTGAVVMALPSALLTIFAIKLLLTMHNPKEKLSVEWADILCQFITYALFFVGYCLSFMHDILRQEYPSYVRYFCTLVISALYILVADCFFRHDNLLSCIRTEISVFMKQDPTVSRLIRSAAAMVRTVMVIAVVFATVIVLLDFPSKQQPINVQAAESAEVLADTIPDARADVYLCIPSNNGAYAKLHHQIYFDLLDECIRIKNYFPSAIITDPSFGYTCDNFLEMLRSQDYDYVMLTSVDEEILALFGELFADAALEDTNLIYQVTPNGLVRVN